MRSGGLRLGAVSALWYAIAFNIAFFVQELFLVVPKALTPGLSPVLYHNNHSWSGEHPIADLLQGTGAVATMVLGLVALLLLRRGSWLVGGRLAIGWLAYHGFYMALPQFMLGAFISANDIGQAMGWLGLGEAARLAIAGVALAAAVGIGRLLAPEFARVGRIWTVAGWPALVGSLLVIPFRVPRDPIEVAIVPLMVLLAGVPWLLLFGRRRGEWMVGIPGLAAPLLLLGALLALFQLVLRPGIAF